MRLAPLAVLGLTAVVAVPAAAEPHQAVVARLALGDLDGAASAWAWAAGGSADALAQVALLWLGLSDEVRAATHAEALERRACEAIEVGAGHVQQAGSDAGGEGEGAEGLARRCLSRPGRADRGAPPPLTPLFAAGSFALISAP